MPIEAVRIRPVAATARSPSTKRRRHAISTTPVGHHVAGAPRRARWPQTRPAPHPVHDVATEPDGRQQTPQVRQGRRRRHGQLPPAWRRRHLRHPGTYGATVFAAVSVHRGIGKPSDPSTATHRRPCVTRSVASRDSATNCSVNSKQDTVPFRPNYDSTKVEPVVLPSAPAEPARERRNGHCRRHGHQHPRRTTSARSARPS